MPYPQHFIVEGRHLGTSMRGLQKANEARAIPPSYAYFCPVCAEVWARCPVELFPGRYSQFMSLTRSCRKHKQTSTLQEPGSMMLAWDHDYNACLPDAVVKWEFDRVMERLERRENGNYDW